MVQKLRSIRDQLSHEIKDMTLSRNGPTSTNYLPKYQLPTTSSALSKAGRLNEKPARAAGRRAPWVRRQRLAYWPAR
ncbi:MAG: hypothetical protein WKG07_32835 [Hymenobacter sp.]